MKRNASQLGFGAAHFSLALAELHCVMGVLTPASNGSAFTNRLGVRYVITLENSSVLNWIDKKMTYKIEKSLCKITCKPIFTYISSAWIELRDCYKLFNKSRYMLCNAKCSYINHKSNLLLIFGMQLTSKIKTLNCISFISQQFLRCIYFPQLLDQLRHFLLVSCVDIRQHQLALCTQFEDNSHKYTWAL